MKAQKKLFSVLKRPLLSEGEVKTTFKAIEKFTCAVCGRKKSISIEEPPGWTFSLKKYKPNKDDNVLKRDIRKIDDIYFYLNCFP